jgi:hypothetical protein
MEQMEAVERPRLAFDEPLSSEQQVRFHKNTSSERRQKKF